MLELEYFEASTEHLKNFFTSKYIGSVSVAIVLGILFLEVGHLVIDL